jgi:hypothetical protein
MEFLKSMMGEKPGLISGDMKRWNELALRCPHDRLRVQDHDTTFVSVKFSSSFV